MTGKIDKQAIIADLQRVAQMLNTQHLGKKGVSEIWHYKLNNCD